MSKPRQETRSVDGAGEGQIKLNKMIRTELELLCCSYAEQGRLLAAGSTTGSLELFQNRGGKYTASLTDTDVTGVQKTDACPLVEIVRCGSGAAGRESSLLCAYAPGMIKNWNVKTQKCLYTIKENRQILGLTYHPCDKRFVTLGEDGVIFMYDEETRKPVQKFSPSDFKVMDGHSNRVFSACFHPQQEREFVSGGWDRTVQFWDTRMQHGVRHISDVYMCGDGLDVSRSGQELLVCAWEVDKPMRLYDYRSAKLHAVLQPDVYSSQLYCGKYISANYFVAGGTNANLLRVVDVRTSATLGIVRGLPGAVYSLDTVPRAIKLAGSSPAAAPASEAVYDLPNVLFCSGKNIYEIKFTYYLACVSFQPFAQLYFSSCSFTGGFRTNDL